MLTISDKKFTNQWIGLSSNALWQYDTYVLRNFWFFIAYSGENLRTRALLVFSCYQFSFLPKGFIFTKDPFSFLLGKITISRKNLISPQKNNNYPPCANGSLRELVNGHCMHTIPSLQVTQSTSHLPQNHRQGTSFMSVCMHILGPYLFPRPPSGRKVTQGEKRKATTFCLQCPRAARALRSDQVFYFQSD